MKRWVGVAAGLAVVAGGLAWWGWGRGSGSVPEPWTEVLALPGEVTVDPSLPEALPLPEGIWEETGPGWVLATYRVSGIVDNYRMAGPQVVYLIAPTGERYQVAELPTEPVVRLKAWLPGTTTATVLPGEWDYSGTWSGDEWSTLDLTTGEVASNGWSGLSYSAQFVDFTAEGAAVWVNPGIAPDWPLYGIVDESGTAVTYDYTGPRQPLWAWVEGDPSASPPDVGTVVCQTVAVYDADSLLDLCYAWPDDCCDAPPGLVATQDYRYVRRWIDGSGQTQTLHLFTVDDPAPSFSHAVVAGDRVVYEGSDWRARFDAPGVVEPLGVFVLEDGAITPLAGADATGYRSPPVYFVSVVGESTVYTQVGGDNYWARATLMVLVRTDLDTGKTTVLIPYPAADALGEGEAVLEYAMTSYIVASAFPVSLDS